MILIKSKIISLNNIHWLTFLLEMDSVLWEVEVYILYAAQINVNFQSVNVTFLTVEGCIGLSSAIKVLCIKSCEYSDFLCRN